MMIVNPIVMKMKYAGSGLVPVEVDETADAAFLKLFFSHLSSLTFKNQTVKMLLLTG